MAYADMGKRFAAKLIDIVIGVIIGLPFNLLFGTTKTTSAGVEWKTTNVIPTLIVVAAWAAYEILLVSTKGATVGKMALGLRVVNEADGQIPSTGTAALRWLIQFAGYLVCCIGEFLVWASPLFDNTKRNQGWHDKVAKTFVVQA
ncbi:MAG: RDD family protein [Kineosporiaceae bacterium]